MKLLSVSQLRTRMMAQSLWLFLIALGAKVHIMKSLPQISLVMASWLLKAIPPSFSRSFSLPSSLALPFCHLCSGTYRVATGFLFSGNVLDERKATWSDLRGTTCRRLIFQFSSFIFFPAAFLFVWPSSRGAGGAAGFRRPVAGFPSALIANTQLCVLRVLVFWSGGILGWGHTERSGVAASERVWEA